MKPYEQIVRVLTAFFAALVGIGIKKILDLNVQGSENYRLPCFIIAVCLSLRFITGSTTHLYLEYVEAKDPPIAGLIWDLIVLVLFGGLCALLCDAKNIDTFWGFCIGITGTAFLWGAAIMVAVKVFAGGSMINFIKNAKWSEWMIIDGLQLAVFGLAVYGEHSYPPDPVLHWELWVVVAWCVLFFVWDLHYQLCNLKNASIERAAEVAAAKGEAFVKPAMEQSLWKHYLSYRERIAAGRRQSKVFEGKRDAEKALGQVDESEINAEEQNENDPK